MKTLWPKHSKRAIFYVSILMVALYINLDARVQGYAYKSKASSDLRGVTVSFATRYYSNPKNRYDPSQLQDMASFLREMARVELINTEVLLHFADKDHFLSTPPEFTGRLKTKNDWSTFEFLPEILKFPIGFNVAVYENLDLPTSETPILWTRGLHRYDDFNAPYGGHVAYLDGHIRYFEGTSEGPEAELKELFGPGSIYSQAIRILEHEPDTWKQRSLPPLPVRVESHQPVVSKKRIYLMALNYLGPAFFVGLFFAAFPNRTIGERILRFIIAGGIVLLATLILVPSF